MTDLHPWQEATSPLTGKFQQQTNSHIHFLNGEEVLRLDKDGFHYRGQFIEDAGEAHRLMVGFLRQGTAPALAEQPVGQSRRCIYNPVQIAECGGPCEQIGPEACDCGALWVDQDTEQPVGPTDEGLREMWFGSEWFNEGATLREFISIARAVLARWGQS